ncbi:MAG: hypothetical protein O7G85_14435 [Planctomycetota bacterium]|nr:hypothetical protein [Planctomycetota bacterium]
MARNNKTEKKRDEQGNWGRPRRVAKAPARDMDQAYVSLRTFQSRVDSEHRLYEAIVKLEKLKHLPEGDADRVQRERIKTASKRRRQELKAKTYGCTFSRVSVFEERMIRVIAMVRDIEYEQARTAWKWEQKLFTDEGLVKQLRLFLDEIDGSKRTVAKHFRYWKSK